MKRFYLLLVLCLITGCIFAGCGKKDTQKSDSSTPDGIVYSNDDDDEVVQQVLAQMLDQNHSADEIMYDLKLSTVLIYGRICR